jgi:hypothetical protein
VEGRFPHYSGVCGPGVRHHRVYLCATTSSLLAHRFAEPIFDKTPKGSQEPDDAIVDQYEATYLLNYSLTRT